MVDQRIDSGQATKQLDEKVMPDDLETVLWQSLEMDSLRDEMTTGSFPHGDPIFMGTGHTHNACYMCSNSATTAGCGTCG